MRKIVSSILFVLGFTAITFSQSANIGLQITEIMYNPPESGVDSLEFIELQNTNNTNLDISGYKVNIGTTSNPRITFPPNTILAPNSVIVLAFNDSTFINVYGTNPNYKLRGQGLGNNGSTIAVIDGSNTTLTSVVYAPSWYPTTNGSGASLTRCNFTSDINTASSWAAETTAVSTQSVINGRAVLATPGTVTPCTVVTTPLYTIASIHNENANGIADSATVTCELRGVVHSGDFRGSTGIDFALIDHTNNGLFVFSPIDLAGFSVNRGDSVHVIGTINQYNGLIQFTPSSIQVKSVGNALVNPMVITALNESTEGKLIKIQGLTIDQITNSSPSGFTILATNGIGNLFSIRVDADVDAFSHTFIPGEQFTVTGIGTQLDTSEPYTDGYNIQVRDLADFDFTLNVDKVNASSFNLYPNPTSSKITLSNLPSESRIKVIDFTGRVIQEKESTLTSEVMDLSICKAGIYVIQVETSHQTMQEKVIVK